MKKKLLSVVLTAVMAASVLTGCGSTDNGTASTAAATGTAQSEAAATSAASTDGKVYNIGICQLVEHEALDAATQGYQDALKEKIIKSFFRMAKFYGFRVFYIVGSSGVVEPDDMLEKGWLSKGNHNFLRLTRIMESLQLFGLDNHYKALKECLLVIAAKYPEIIGEKTRTNWEDC